MYHFEWLRISCGLLYHMGVAELHESSGRLLVHSVFYFYGNAASGALAVDIAEDISRHWNRPSGTVMLKSGLYQVQFRIEGYYMPDLDPEAVWYNTDPRNNYFRIEEFSMSHISFVDGLKSNTGYFKLDNLLHHSTTAAHEYGHTLGLDHPQELDIRGKGQPGIMYPRGTLCDPAYQYDPAALAMQPGGTMNPHTRIVRQEDIDALRLAKLPFDQAGRSTVGDFSSLYHSPHLPS